MILRVQEIIYHRPLRDPALVSGSALRIQSPSWLPKVDPPSCSKSQQMM